MNFNLSKREKLVADVFFADLGKEVSIDKLRDHVARKEGKDVENVTRRSINGTIKSLGYKLSGIYSLARVSDLGAGAVGKYRMDKIETGGTE